MIALLAVVAVIVVTFVLSVLVERVLGRSRKEMVKPGWYVVFFAVSLPALLLVYSTVSVANPALYAAYALAGGMAALVAQCLFGARLNGAQSQSKGDGEINSYRADMTLLASAAPELLAEIRSALSAAGYEATASQLEAGTIAHCTYDDSVEAGYIYLVRSEPSPHFAKLAAPVAKTLPFLDVGFNVDVDHGGNIFGVEFLNRPDFVSELRHANVL